MKQVTFFQNSHSGGPGLLGKYLEARGWQIRSIVDFTEAQSVAAEDLLGDLVVFLGSPRSAFEMEVPWIAHEFALMQKLLRQGNPTVGICFGAQLLARVAGGEVRTMDAPFRGWHTNDAVASPEWRGPWLRWHRDRIYLPPSIAPLAESEGIVQGFKVGNAVGIQFHPEVTLETLSSWVDDADGEIAPPVLHAALHYFERNTETVERRTEALFDHVLLQYLNL